MKLKKIDTLVYQSAQNQYGQNQYGQNQYGQNRDTNNNKYNNNKLNKNNNKSEEKKKNEATVKNNASEYTYQSFAGTHSLLEEEHEKLKAQFQNIEKLYDKTICALAQRSKNPKSLYHFIVKIL